MTIIIRPPGGDRNLWEEDRLRVDQVKKKLPINGVEEQYSRSHHRLKAEAKDLSRNKPSIKPESAGRGFYARFISR